MSRFSFTCPIAIGTALTIGSLAVPPVQAQTTPPATATPLDHAVTLNDATLGEERGGQAIVIGNQALQSSLSGNTIAGNYIAGAISLWDNAFANFNGMGNVVINSGAQANLQSAMNLTVNLGN